MRLGDIISTGRGQDRVQSLRASRLGWTRECMYLLVSFTLLSSQCTCRRVGALRYYDGYGERKGNYSGERILQWFRAPL
jgi:hypothetical protein